MGLGFNKVLYKIAGETIIEKAMKAFKEDPDCEKIICVLNKEDQEKLEDKTSQIIFSEGGKERIDSVYNALKKVTSPFVMIHDGARPDITLEDLNALKKALEDYDAACLGKYAKDTIKVVKDGIITKTLDRKEIFLAQTPQVFKSELIKKAYQKAKEEDLFFTDDTGVFEHYINKAIKAVEAKRKNDKITFKEDLITNTV